MKAGQAIPENYLVLFIYISIPSTGEGLYNMKTVYLYNTGFHIHRIVSYDVTLPIQRTLAGKTWQMY